MNIAEDNPKENWKLPFFTIWTAQSFSLLGSQLVQFALIWYLTKTTQSPTVLAMASLVGLLPGIVLGPLTGALVDRWNRRVIMMVADAVAALATLALAALFLGGVVQIWHIYALMFVRSLAGGFHGPAMQASTSLMVPKKHLGRVQGLNQMLGGGLNIISAPLGALLLELLPMQGVLAVDVITALFAITPLFFIAVPQPKRKLAKDEAGGKTSVWQEVLAGLRYAFSWPGLVMVGILAAFINLVVSPAMSLLPLVITGHFNGGAPELAGIQSALGIGVVVGGLLLGVWGGFKRQIFTTLSGVVVIGMALAAFGLMPASMFLPAAGMMLLAGLAMPIANGPLMAVVQAAVEPEMQGRVFTLMGAVSMGMMPLGLIFAAPVAEAFGVRIWFVMGGAITVLLGTAGFLIPAIVHIEEGRSKTVQTSLSSND